MTFLDWSVNRAAARPFPETSAIVAPRESVPREI